MGGQEGRQQFYLGGPIRRERAKLEPQGQSGSFPHGVLDRSGGAVVSAGLSTYIFGGGRAGEGVTAFPKSEKSDKFSGLVSLIFLICPCFRTVPSHLIHL